MEATCIQKEEKLTLTGHLGQVMQESARAARSCIWSLSEKKSEKLGIDRARVEEQGVHVHVPEGAVPKDGPSAGVTIATAMVSAYRQQPVRPEVAMTGELTLTGLVLPVGGIKEKVLAAHRNGIRQVILPEDNQPELRKLPDAVRDEMTFIPVGHLDQVLEAAFDS